jgi:hypothetical protein
MRQAQVQANRVHYARHTVSAPSDLLRDLRPLQQLKDALAEARFEDAELIVERVSTINYPVDGDCTLLHIFSTGVSLQPTETVEFLLRHGADPNAKAVLHGGTPLHDAAFANKSAICKRLLDYQADRTIKNNSGLTPQALAEFWGMKEVVGVLKEYTPEKLEIVAIKSVAMEAITRAQELIHEGEQYAEQHITSAWHRIFDGLWPHKKPRR